MPKATAEQLHEKAKLYATPVGRDPPVTLSLFFTRTLKCLTLDVWTSNDWNRITALQAPMHRTRCHCAAFTGHDNALLETQ